MKLSVGNLVTDRYWESFKTVITVESVDGKGINLTASDDNKPYGMHMPMLEYEYTFDELRGIPLTKEWFPKLGLGEISEESDWSLNGMVNVVMYENGTFHVFVSCDYELMELEYVHELQNLCHVLKVELKTVTV